MTQSLKILVILALVSSVWAKPLEPLEPNIVDQFEDVTSNANHYNISPEMKKSLQEILQNELFLTIKSTCKFDW